MFVFGSAANSIGTGTGTDSNASQSADGIPSFTFDASLLSADDTPTASGDDAVDTTSAEGGFEFTEASATNRGEAGGKPYKTPLFGSTLSPLGKEDEKYGQHGVDMMPSRPMTMMRGIEDEGPTNPSRPQHAGADVSAYMTNALQTMMSSMLGDTSNLQDCCCETNWRGLPAQELFLASMRHDVDRLQDLLADPDMKSLVNDRDGDKSGILHNVCLNKVSDQSSKIIEMLVEAGCNVDMKGGVAQETALSIACTYSKYEHVEALVKAGARVDISDCFGKTPLDHARENFEKRGKKLLSKKRGSTDDAKKIYELVGEANSLLRNDASRAQLAEKIRQEGNKAFSKKQFKNARKLYTDSLAVLEDHRTFSNRALCSIKIGRLIFEKFGKFEQKDDGTYYTNYPDSVRQWGDEVVTDAGKALEMNGDFEKSHYRLVLGHAMRRDFPRAKRACAKGQKRFPDNVELKKSRAFLEQLHTPDEIEYGMGSSEADRLVDEGCDACQCSYCFKIQPFYEEKNRCVTCGMDMAKYEPGVFAPLIIKFVMGYT